MLSRLSALRLLSECVGDQIWSVPFCREKGVPDTWIEELVDCYESGFQSDRQTIYYQDRVVNQYHGLRDVDLAFKLAELMGVDAQRATELAIGSRAQVRALREAVEEA